jgi:hypothetical protein|tara:strand:- start:2619 stop:3818 length:1200 start_codon:yes stop_codon:yes gene_type:complete
VYFQALDDKTNCVGIYFDGRLIFDESMFPATLSGMKTWKYSGSIREDVEYAWFYADGKGLDEVCPEHLTKEFSSNQSKLLAFKKAFDIAKIDFREHCFFELVPHDYLRSFLDIKNKITQYVIENYEKPETYDHLIAVEKLLYKIRYNELNVSNKDCRNLFVGTNSRINAQKILKCPRYIDYNIYGTKTGRLTTQTNSFPILTMKKELRALLKPKNDWFISLDYNGAEVRTVLSLLEKAQPDYDVHEWNMENTLKHLSPKDRESAKTIFFAWLYNPNSKKIERSIYDREAILDQYYDGNKVTTPFGRKIVVDKQKSLNYIIQSTTADLVNDRAVAIDKFLDDKESFVSHIVHDEIVIDMPDNERHLIPEIKDIFSNNKLDIFKTNLKAGKDYYNLGDLNL